LLHSGLEEPPGANPKGGWLALGSALAELDRMADDLDAFARGAHRSPPAEE
jgi:hypothetical protein